MFQVLTLEGTPAAMGRQHGQQVAHLRPLIVGAAEARLADLHLLGADDPALVAAAHAALEAHDRPLLEFLGGLAQALDVPPDMLLTYTLSSYLRDLYKVTHPLPASMPSQVRDGCTTWAVAAPWTVDGAPILAKNRDYHLDHLPLQLLTQVKPEHGYRYLALGSAGSPEVFSSGINERGLAVADTHVLSADMGPGLPRFSLMRAMLQEHDSTCSALDYLRSVPHMGAGTLLLADARGHLALCESGHARCGYLGAGAVEPTGNGPTASGPAAAFLASANHFATPELAAQWVEDEPPLLRGNSPARRNRVLAALADAPRQVDARWAQTLMCAHGTPRDALCRHAYLPPDQPPDGRFSGSTIASAVYLPCGLPADLQGDPSHDPAGDPPARPAVLLAYGQPCVAHWEARQVG